MARKVLVLWIMLLVTTATADVLVLTNGKALRVESYRVEGRSMVVTINERAEMVIPLEWISQIRATPKVSRSSDVSPNSNGRFDFAYSEMVLEFSNKHHVDWRLIAAVMKIESNFNPRALSSKGALGLMQLMPETARLYQVADPYDPAENIEAGIKHLRMLMERYSGKLDLALAAYNSGHRTVDRYRGIPPYDETRQYVRKVLKLYQGLSRTV